MKMIKCPKCRNPSLEIMNGIYINFTYLGEDENTIKYCCEKCKHIFTMKK